VRSRWSRTAGVPLAFENWVRFAKTGPTIVPAERNESRDNKHWPMIMGPRFRGDDRVGGDWVRFAKIWDRLTIGFVSPKWPTG